MAKIRVLVVDDAVVFRRLISEVLANDPALEVVGTALGEVPGQPPQQLPGLLVPFRARLAEQAVRLVEAAVPEGLLGLPFGLLGV